MQKAWTRWLSGGKIHQTKAIVIEIEFFENNNTGGFASWRNQNVVFFQF